MAGVRRSHDLSAVDAEFKSRAEKLVKDHWYSAEKVKEVRVVDVEPDFFGGDVFIVEIIELDGQHHENVIFHKGKSFRRFDDWSDLTRSVGRFSLLQRAFADSGLLALLFAGVIGLLIVITICILAVSNSTSNLRDALTSALTLVLGFFFGSATKSRSRAGAKSHSADS